MKQAISVKRGEVYSVPRRGMVAAHIKIVRVVKGQQPRVWYRRVTRSGGTRYPLEMSVARWLNYQPSSKSGHGVWVLPGEWRLV